MEGDQITMEKAGQCGRNRNLKQLFEPVLSRRKKRKRIFDSKIGEEGYEVKENRNAREVIERTAGMQRSKNLSLRIRRKKGTRKLRLTGQDGGCPRRSRRPGRGVNTERDSHYSGRAWSGL